jgi:hypothetical protein
METGLFEIQANHLRELRWARRVHPTFRGIVYALFRMADSVSYNRIFASRGTVATEAVPSSEPNPIGSIIDSTVELARCFLRLANLPNFALDRLGL